MDFDAGQLGTAFDGDGEAICCAVVAVVVAVLLAAADYVVRVDARGEKLEQGPVDFLWERGADAAVACFGGVESGALEAGGGVDLAELVGEDVVFINAGVFVVFVFFVRVEVQADGVVEGGLGNFDLNAFARDNASGVSVSLEVFV